MLAMQQVDLQLKKMGNLHLCYAGAGAGKTHTLVQTYLAKALKKPAFFGRILAITFTNKATKEMKERIINYLDRLVKGTDKALGEELQQALGCDAVTLQRKGKALLTMILHDYQEFSVCTIDGFFQMIVRAFAGELGLPLSYGLLLDVAPILEDTLWGLLATLARYPRLVSAFTALSIDKIQQGKSWDCTGAIRQLGKMLLLDHGDNLDGGGAVGGDTGATIENFFRSQKAASVAFKAQLKDMAGDLLESIKGRGLCVKDFAWGGHGVVGFLEKLYAKKEVKPSMRIYNAVAKRGHWVSTKSVHYSGMAGVVQDHWQPRLGALLDFYDRGYRGHATFRALQPLYYAMASVGPLGELLRQHELLQTNLPVAYLPDLLGRVEAGVAVAFLYEKLGRHYDALLIDEFQDVSRGQWARLHPLLHYGLERGQDSFLVGDVKQAIYRWRGGDAGLFLFGVAATMGADRIRETALGHNWRSRRHIVAFNNVFFKMAADALSAYLEALVDETGRVMLGEGMDHQQIKKAYKHVAQQLPKKSTDSDLGYVELAFFPKKNATVEDYHWRDGAIARTIKKVEELQQVGYKLSDIGILVRDNKEARQLLDAFLGYKKSEEAIRGLSYEAYGIAGEKLGDNPYIQLLVHGLMYVGDPRSGFTLTTLIHLYQTYGGEVSRREFTHQYWMAGGEMEGATVDLLPHVLLKEVTTLGRLPLYLLVDKLISLFGLKKAVAWPYVAIFQGQVDAFLRDHGGHLMDFLAWWERMGHQVSCELDVVEDSLQVMTIHKAKGLAFDIVLLPFCAWPLDHPPT
ncbi:MAG: UvrD-helicase domain-containing protein, partial [Bacteroidota bacterium]